MRLSSLNLCCSDTQGGLLRESCDTLLTRFNVDLFLNQIFDHVSFKVGMERSLYNFNFNSEIEAFIYSRPKAVLVTNM